MFSRPFLSQKISTESEPDQIAGKFYTVPGTDMKIYIPSWTLGVATFPKQLILEQNKLIVTTSRSLLIVTNDFIENKPISELADIALAQSNDKNLSQITDWLKNKLDLKF